MEHIEIADRLAELICEENTKLDFKEIKEEISDDLKNDRYHLIVHKGNDIGFLTWIETYKFGKRYIYLNNLWIDSKYRRTLKMFHLREFFRKKFPGALFYWHRDKKNKFFYHQ